MFVIATDLDRTLLPNGNQEYDGTMPIFIKIIKNEKLKLIYVTGRNLKQVKDALIEFHAPLPHYIVGEVGTKIFYQVKDRFEEDNEWNKIITSVTRNWNIDNFKEELSVIKDLRIQEDYNQNRFKLSYYVDNLGKSDIIVKEITKIIRTICKDATIVYSVDETHNIGLLDIIPKYATKLEALEFLRKKVGFKKGDVVYCGDSGNDILPLTFGYKAILVKNAIEDVKSAVKEISIQKDIIDNLYIAKGYKKLNGYYVSGIIEGLIRLGVVSSKYIETE